MVHATRNILIALLLIVGMVLAVLLRPTYRMANHGPAISLEKMIPSKFGEWKLEPEQNTQIVNPQIKATLDRIYTQTVSRTYLNNRNQRVMLSVAYGPDQGDAKALHYPEVCYPAQGFKVTSMGQTQLHTDFGNIKVKKLIAQNSGRTEPITYWTTVGDKVVRGAREAKLTQLEYGFKGVVPDGLIFRVSSISDSEEDFLLHQSFVAEVVKAMSAENRAKIAGLY